MEEVAAADVDSVAVSQHIDIVQLPQIPPMKLELYLYLQIVGQCAIQQMRHLVVILLVLASLLVLLENLQLVEVLHQLRIQQKLALSVNSINVAAK